jgi:hypothetical protein
LKAFIYTFDLQPVKNLPENKQVLKNLIMQHFYENCHDLLDVLEQKQVASFDKGKVGNIRMAFGSLDSIRTRVCDEIGLSKNSTQKFFLNIGLSTFARFCKPMMPNIPFKPQNQLNVANQEIFHLSTMDRLFLLMDENQKIKTHVREFFRRYCTYENEIYQKFETMTVEELQRMVKDVTACRKPQELCDSECKNAILDHFGQHCYELMGDGFEKKKIGKIDLNAAATNDDSDITYADHIKHVLQNVDDDIIKMAATILDIEFDSLTPYNQIVDSIVTKSSVDYDSFKTFMETIESLDIAHHNMQTEETTNNEMGKCFWYD